jgi:hypothetical protein
VLNLCKKIAFWANFSKNRHKKHSSFLSIFLYAPLSKANLLYVAILDYIRAMREFSSIPSNQFSQQKNSAKE